MAQALVRFLANQYVERDGQEQRFFAGCFGIFGHGNVAGVGQALQQYAGAMPYYQARNEQAMVHSASAYARQKNRLQTLACTTSIGPGATNMVTGAALATINRLPVLLLPGDIFASRGPDPVLQQLEAAHDGTLSVNDCFRPVSRYFDRIVRPEQLMPAALAAMRVLTNQAETGAVTLALPQDVQAEACDYPEEFFDRRVWRVGRPLPEVELVDGAALLVRESDRPVIVSGGGTIYSGATEALRRLAEATGVPVAETQAGKGSMPYDHPLALGAVGATGTFAANRAAREADLVVGVGTRWSDFTTASKTAFQNPNVRFVNINVADFDAHKHAGLGLVGDARATLEALKGALDGYEVDPEYREQSGRANAEWDREVERLYTLAHGPLPAQSEVLGAVNSCSGPEDVVVCAAGSMPGDLHKLWRTRDPKGYHVEYGYSTMGYEIAGGLGIKMAAPEREVYVMCGDGSYLMMNAEIVTSIQEGYKLTIVLVDNSGFSSIGALSRSVGSQGFGTQ
jgi:3D-(3,5/4)-trihydroxycyclohexane-1,2-dione acylhydrolase (decyclizing)